MKRYAFPLEKVLRVRRLQEDVARTAVAAARSAEQVAAAAAAASRQRYTELTPVDTPATTASVLAHQQLAGLRATAVHQSEQQRRGAAEATSQALSGWHDCHRRVDALERLDGRRRDEHAVADRRAEDAAADEIVSARARRRP